MAKKGHIVRVRSEMGVYSAWLLERGWQGDENRPWTEVERWEAIKRPSGAHAGARPTRRT